MPEDAARFGRREILSPLGLAFALVLSSLVGPVGSAPAQGLVLGNRESKIYHKPSCASAKRLSVKNRVAFASMATAEAEGFTACQSCRPNAVLLGQAGQGDPTSDPTVDPEVEPTTGQDRQDGGELRFSRDIAPVIVGNCLGCHNAQQKRGSLDMSSFRKLLAGSGNGPIVVAGKPDESELIRRVTGVSSPKMPPGNNRNLAEETIGKLRKWIEAGALLDAGVDPNGSLSEISATPEELRRQELSKLSAAELDQKLDEAAAERWKKAQPNANPARVAGEHVVLYGDIPEGRLKEAVKVLDRAYETLAALLSRPGKPALAGPVKVSAYVFKERNGFVEFVRSVLRREVEEEDRITGDLAAEVPFVVTYDPLGGQEESSTSAGASRKSGRSSRKEADAGPERGLNALLVEGLATEAARSAGKPPRWLAEGLGELMAAQIEPRGARVARLRAIVMQQQRLGWMTKSVEALGDQGEPLTVRAMGFSALEFLWNKYRPQYAPFIRGMLDGQEKLDEGLQFLFGASRQEFLVAWGQWSAAQYGRN